MLGMVRDSSKSVVEFFLTVPGAFGSVWAIWSAVDVSISLATGGAIKPMSSPVVQLAALGTASGIGMLSLLVNYDRLFGGAPAEIDVNSELQGVTIAQPADISDQHQHVCKALQEIKKEWLSSIAHVESPS